MKTNYLLLPAKFLKLFRNYGFLDALTRTNWYFKTQILQKIKWLILVRKFLHMLRNHGLTRAIKRAIWYLGIDSSQIPTHEMPSKETNVSLQFTNLGRDAEGISHSGISFIHKPHKCNVKCGNNPQISIILPTIGRSKFLEECLNAISNSCKHAEVDYEVILAVDSGATSLELKAIGNAVSAIGCVSVKTLVHDSYSSGFANQVNSAVAQARAETILILNDDAIANLTMMRELLNARIYRPNSILSPIILNPNGTLQELGSIITPMGNTEWIGTNHSVDWVKNLSSLKVDFISAVCWILPKEVFISAGGFKNFGGLPYYEDTRFAYSLAESLETYVIASAYIRHELSQSTTDVVKRVEVDDISRGLFLDWWKSNKPKKIKKLKVAAFYLPQFHATDYNDHWWGTGYTEWTAVSRRKNILTGQSVEPIPGELGFYNLMSEETLIRQSHLAAHYGIDAFAVMTYWFSGLSLLDKPLSHFKNNDLPTNFFLYWANESWSRRWDGFENELLIEQKHSTSDFKDFIRAHESFFKHPNYQRILGKPVIFIYRRENILDLAESLRAMREEAIALGIGDLFICALESFDQSMLRENPTSIGFDGAVEYPPHGRFPLENIDLLPGQFFDGLAHDYNKLVKHYLDRAIPNFPVMRAATPGFDNTARLGSRSTVFLNASLNAFHDWLYRAAKNAMVFGDEMENWIIINGWNEWSEAATLEPSVSEGRNYLASIKIVKDVFNSEKVNIRHE
jgi:GT2 family glycosyltransferase